MSIFAGVLCISSPGLSDAARAELEAAFPSAGLRVSRHSDPQFQVLHGSLGVLGEEEFVRTSASVGALAGSLLFDHSPAAEPLREAVRAVVGEELELFSRANGTFACCVYEPGRQRLTVVSDSLGARPVYYAVADGRLYFSSSLSVLERIEAVPKRPDLAACIEQEALCYPLGPRTVYADVHVLRDNEALVANPGGLELRRYFDWAREPLAEGESVDRMAAHARRAVRAAVADRAAPGSRVRSLLSGGLDSRVVVAELLDLGCQVDAATVALPGTQDPVYAARFAAAAGVALETVPWKPDLPGLTAGATTSRLLTAAVAGRAPGAVFSGDGGGETLGFLLVDPNALASLARGEPRRGAEQYLAHYRPAARLFRSAVSRRLRKVAVDRLHDQLGAIGSPSLEKALHISVLVNDLRCHLHEYFDRIVETRVELLLPFYDRRVVASVVRLPPPLAPHLGHAFYHRLLPLLPPVVQASPWQVYPGHLPCPVQDPEPPPLQWTAGTRAAADLWGRQALRAALVGSVPPFVRRWTVVGAALGHALRLSNYGYLFRSFLELQRLGATASSWVVPGEDAGEAPMRRSDT
jgi:asparagine synthetase B (glutamine-hydrolysing)